MKTLVVILAVVLLSSFAGAENPPVTHFTGVPQVDLFSMRNFGTSAHLNDTTPQFPSSLPDVESKKSPWLAGALSAVVPGAGEIYSGSYLKGAIFLGIEVGSWITAYVYDKKGDDQTTLFQNYANEHWSPIRYGIWTYDHAEMLSANSVTPDDGIFYDDIEDLRDNPGQPPFSNVNWDGLNTFEREIADASNTNGEKVVNGYTHVLPYYGQQQYYELIGKYVQFYSGWDDAVSGEYAMGDVKPSDFTPSVNSRYKIYANMRAQANDYYDVASAMISVIIINHVISAFDAAWTAARFNNALQAHVDVKLQRTPFGVVPIKQAQVSWTF